MEDPNQEQLIIRPITLNDFLDMEIELEEENRGGKGAPTPRESDLTVARSKLKLDNDDSEARKLLDERIKFLTKTLEFTEKKEDRESISGVLTLYSNLNEYLSDEEK